MRINQQFSSLFPKDSNTGKYHFSFVWKEQEYRYDFHVLPLQAVLNNARLGIDRKNLLNEVPLSSLHKDVVALLLFGSTCTDQKVAETLIKCEVGALLGLNKEIDKFVDQRYIWVSRITGGAQANTLGQNAQSYVVTTLKKKLGSGFTVESNGYIDVGSEKIPFDVVVTKAGISVGVEVSFQVTTNSTIERKANEAVNRFKLIHEAGHRLAYIIDGAGNFQRRSALVKICSHSDCTVAYTNEELDVLVSFIREVLH